MTDDITAELAKLAENSFRDINIAFANELAAVAEGIEIDPLEVIRLANKHPRVNIHQPGIGVGGHCLPLDPWFIKQVDAENTTLISAARLVNDATCGSPRGSDKRSGLSRTRSSWPSARPTSRTSVTRAKARQARSSICSVRMATPSSTWIHTSSRCRTNHWPPRPAVPTVW